MLTVRSTALNLHQPGPAYDHLLEHVTAGNYGLVVVDTLRRVSGSADGNSSEMGAVIDNLDRIKHATDRGTVLVVAHTGKDDNDTRGYSGIEDDADVVWSAKRDDLLLTLELNKMKDGRDGIRIPLEVQPSGIGSIVITGATGLRQVDTTENQQRILDALAVMPAGGVTGPELMATAELKKATFYRAVADLEQAHLITLTKVKRTNYYELAGQQLDLAQTDEDDTDETTGTPDEQPTLDHDQDEAP